MPMVEKRGFKVNDVVDGALSRRRAVSSLSSWLARFVMRVLGWQLVGEPPDVPKYVLIAAPHTSNWDFLIVLALDFAFKVGCVWMGKDSGRVWSGLRNFCDGHGQCIPLDAEGTN